MNAADLPPRDERIQDLLAHAGFVRGLSRALVCDAAIAEDVAQETLLAAIQADAARARVPTTRLRAWLTGIVKNLVRQTRRSEMRRARRESELAAPEPAPSAADAVARLDLIERLVLAVRRLDEPYRSAVLARFFEGRSATEIAQAEGVPVETVRTRLKRAIERLRTTLDLGARDEAGRGHWSALLLPIAGLPPTTIGAIAMTTKGKALAAAALLLVASIAGIAWQAKGARARRTALADARAAVAASRSEVRSKLDASLQARARRELETEDAVAAEDPLATFVVRGIASSGITHRAWPLARIRAQRWDGWEIAGAPLVDVLLRAEEDGAFAWKLRPIEGASWLRLAIEQSGCRGTSAELLIVRGDPAPDDVRLSVHPLDRRVVGHVLDSAGRPVAGACVGCIGIQVVECDDTGAYEIAACSSDGWDQLHAWAPGHARSRAPLRFDVDDDPIVEEFRLDPGATLAGMVTDEAGRAIEGALVRNSSNEVVTGADGRYRLDFLAPVIQQDVDAFVAGRLREAKKLSLTAGENRCDFVLRPGVPVSGVALLPDGTPARGARIFLGFSRYAFDRIDAIARDGGEFAFPAVAPGEHRLVVERRGCAPLQQTVTVPEGAEAVNGLVLRLEAGHVLAGEVVDETGAAIAGALVRVFSGREEVGETPWSDAEGRFRIEDLPGSAVDVWIDRPGFVRLVEKVVPDRTDLALELRAAGRAAGRVVDAGTGEPIPRFRIRFVGPVNPAGSIADYSWYERGRDFHSEDGSWDTGDEQIAPGLELGIEASAVGYAPALAEAVEFTEEPDPEDVVLRLRRGAVVEGLVVDERDSSPTAGATVTLVTDSTPLKDGYGRPIRTRRPVATTDGNGRFRLEAVPEGPAKLFVEHADYCGTWSDPFEVPAGGAAMPQEIRLAAGGVIQATVLDGRGHPRANAMILLTMMSSSARDGDERTTTTDAEGRFRVAGLPPGRWQVCVTSPSSGEWPQPVARFVELGKGEHASFTMPRGSRILAGRLTCAEGLPPSIKIEASRFDPAGNVEREIEVWIDGKLVRGRGRAPLLIEKVQTFTTSDVYELAGLDPGAWTVTAEAWDREQKLRWSARAELVVVDGVDPTLDLDLVRSRH